MVSKLKFHIDDMLSRGSNSLILWLGAISLMVLSAGIIAANFSKQLEDLKSDER